MEINNAHKLQVARFASFFKGKRERLLSAREPEKADFKTDRLVDDQALFNKNDVEDFIDTYHAQMVGSMREGMEEFINIAAVYLSQVFLQAEKSGVVLDCADVNSIEGQCPVAEMAAMMSQGLAPMPAVKRATTLPQLGGDPVMAERIQALESENEQMRERCNLMQTQMSDLLRDRSTLVGQLEKASAGGPGASAATFLQAGDSTQFKELMAIVKKKTAEVKALKGALTAAGLPLPGTGGGLELTPEDD